MESFFDWTVDTWMIIAIVAIVFGANLIAIYLVLKKLNKKMDRSSRAIISMQYSKTLVDDNTASILLETKHPRNATTIRIKHPIPPYVYQYATSAEEIKQAIEDEYQFSENPSLEVHLHLTDTQNYQIIDSRL